MRTIKFRAWDFQNNEMIHGVGITPDSDLKVPYKINPTTNNPEHLDYYPESTLMQFTGLHDKEGREIYEGDIVRLFDKGSDDVELGYNAHVVEWTEEEEFGFPIGWGLFNKTFDYEVIGNIHEHPHLMEQANE